MDPETDNIFNITGMEEEWTTANEGEETRSDKSKGRSLETLAQTLIERFQKDFENFEVKKLIQDEEGDPQRIYALLIKYSQ